MSMIVNVFSQGKNNRVLVGRLWRDKKYAFQYDPHYLKMRTALALGPELPLQYAPYYSKMLFSLLEERIPSTQNPAYADYCREWGIDPGEKDPLILLTTIGHRGPSSFLFRQAPEDKFDHQALRKFRQQLGLSTRELALLLDTDQTTLTKTEMSQLASTQLLRFCALLSHVPSALEFQLDQRGQFLHDHKIAKIKKMINRND